MADLKQIGNTDELRKTMVFETSMPLISWTKFKLKQYVIEVLIYLENDVIWTQAVRQKDFLVASMVSYWRSVASQFFSFIRHVFKF